MVKEVRSNSFGEHHKLTVVDKFGVWLSTRRITKIIKSEKIKTVADLGCGFNANFSKSIRSSIEKCVLVDVALSEELTQSSNFETHVGFIPEILKDIKEESLEFVVLNSVLEHLDDPIGTLEKIYVLLSPGGILFVNVPSWFGKRLLEFLAFRVGLSPTEEMEDHRRYYRRSDLWLALRASGFQPSKIRIRYHKLWTNVYAVVRKS